MKATLLNTFGNITAAGPVTCKKCPTKCNDIIIEVFDEEGHMIGSLLRRISGHTKYLLPNTEPVTEDMLHQLPYSWEASIVGHSQVDTGHGYICHTAVVEFVAPWEVIFQRLRTQLSNPVTRADALMEVRAGMEAMITLGRLLGQKPLTVVDVMGSYEFSSLEKCMLAAFLNFDNAANSCVRTNVGPKYAERHVPVMRELATLLNSTNKNVEVVVERHKRKFVEAHERRFVEELYSDGHMAVTIGMELHAGMYQLHIYHGQKSVGILPQNMLTEQQREQFVKMIFAGQVIPATASWLSSFTFLVSINHDELPMSGNALFVVFGL